MKIQPLFKKTQTTQPSFGYHHPLKTMYKKGMLPQIKRGFYGEIITPKTVSLEHLDAISQGGKTELKNLVLAHKITNNKRGDKPLKDFINFKAMANYLDQFKNIKVKDFDGNKYIAMILETVGRLLNG